MATPTPSFRSWAKALLLIGTVACVGWLGHWSGSRVAASPGSKTSAEPALLAHQQQPGPGYVTHEELGALRAEMHAEFRGLAQSLSTLQRPNAPSEPAPAGNAEAASEVEAAPDANQIQEYDKTKSLLQSALRTGTWSAEDKRAFRASLNTLPASLRNEVIAQLFQAFNTDRLHLGYAGPPI